MLLAVGNTGVSASFRCTVFNNFSVCSRGNDARTSQFCTAMLLPGVYSGSGLDNIEHRFGQVRLLFGLRSKLPRATHN